jgi:hypothetical protein
MKFSEKLEALWKAGKWPLVKDTERNQFTLFTTKDLQGHLRRSNFSGTEREALYQHVGKYGLRPESIDELAEEDNWQIIRTIDPMELMGSGYEKGQKVRILPNAKEECEKVGIVWFDQSMGKMLKHKVGDFQALESGAARVRLQIGSTGYSYIFPLSAIEPYFEDEEVTEIGGVKYSKADIEALVKSAKDLKPLE